ncbi:tetratricopeptide repeat protein [Streptomonospora salina]|uniref:Tetratricopeptide (TPR) repeat protein n=1 Tax=Streptomonospora salina TaxID=104205 RepID=A0A841EIK6_9ACTN|nr:tetratricopeptide (TPR) repeat protein [Streptomonospora salina]
MRRFEEAIDAHTHARTLDQETGDTHREADAWNNLGSALLKVRRFEEAIEAFDRAIRGFQATDDRHGLAVARRNRDRVHRRPRWWAFWKR